MSKLTNQKLARAFRDAALAYRQQSFDSENPAERLASLRICADVLTAIADVYEKAAEE